MHIMIIIIISILIILFTRKPYQSIVVEEYLHRTDGAGNQDVYSEVVFVASVESRLLNILLHHILHLIFVNLSVIKFISVLLG